MDAVTMGSTALTPSRTRKVGGHYFVSGNGLPWPSVEETQTVAYCTCVFGLIKMKFRRLIVLISDDVVLFCPQGKKANLTEFS
jgi:hypothetical protein